MIDEIICFIDMFSLTQHVKIGEQITTVPTNDLGKILPSLCYSNQTNKIHLFGNEMYIEGIISEIIENTDYSTIEIKVN